MKYINNNSFKKNIDSTHIIIDEYSMLSQKLLFIIDMRLKQATGIHLLPFGGINVVLTGDPGQLLPVC